MATENAKSQLNTFCQRQCQKTIGKDDVTYASAKFGTQYQATVTLACLEGIQFAGELAGTVKEAEQNAAAKAIEHFAPQIATLPPAGTKKKRKAEDAGLGDNGTNAAALTAKSQLNSALGRILRRQLQKEDITCNNVNVGTGFQTTLSMPGLPGEWGQLAWAGEVGQNHKQAEENAAVHALAALQSDPTYGPIISAPKVPQQKKFKGSGIKGRGKGGFAGFGGGKGAGTNFFSPQTTMGLLGMMGGAF